jgi:ribonuclease HI
MSILAITANASKSGNKFNPRSGTWTKPQPRTLKLNVDADFAIGENTGAVGAVIRDYRGSLVQANCSLLSHVSTVAMAEALALREGLRLAESLGCHHLVAESDSVETISALTGELRWWNESSAIFADCIDIASRIGDVEFKACPREVNQVAHEIAKFSFNNKSTCNWVDEPPSFLVDKLINDVTIM